MNRIRQVTLGADIEVFVKKYSKEKSEFKGDMSVALRALNEYYGDQLIPSKSKAMAIELTKKCNWHKKGLTGAYGVYSSLMRMKHPSSVDESKAEIVPCIGIIPGTKAKPFAPKGWPKGYAIQEDNVMLEYNIPPASSPQQFYSNLGKASALINDYMKNKKSLQPVWVADHQFTSEQLDNNQAKIFGCDPDRDAYLGGVERCSPPSFENIRTCGGHLHIGGKFNCPDPVFILFLELSLSQNIGAMYVYNKKTPRSKWYGQPGIYRTKPYGVEYRTLDNSWTATSSLRNLVAHTAFKVATMCMNTPAEKLQQMFRSVNWTEFRALLIDGASYSDNRSVRIKWDKLTNNYYETFQSTII